MVRIIQPCKDLGRGNSPCKEPEVESVVFLLEMGGGGWIQEIKESGWNEVGDGGNRARGLAD